MGWTTTYRESTVAAEMADFMRRNNTGAWKLLAHTKRGNTLWGVCEYTRETGEVRRGIICVIYKRYRDGTVGWKDMDETMGPCYYDCPLSYMDLAGPTDSQYAIEWREKVRVYHAAKSAKAKRKYAVGDTVNLKPRYTVSSVIITALSATGKPIQGRAPNGMLYRISTRHLA